MCLFLEAGKEGTPKVSWKENERVRGSKGRGGRDKPLFLPRLCSETADAREQHHWDGHTGYKITNHCLIQVLDWENKREATGPSGQNNYRPYITR